MMRHGRRHNPEKKAWKGKSYKKHGERIRDLKEIEVDTFFNEDGEYVGHFDSAVFDYEEDEEENE